MLIEIQGKAFNPQQVVSMVKDTKYNNMGNATLYRLRVQTEHEAFEFIYPKDIQRRDEDFDKIIDAANGKQADTPQPDCEACELDGKADVCKVCRASNYKPQTDCAWK